MSSMRALLGVGVKSVQYGDISLSGLTLTLGSTVSAVNTAKSVLHLLGTRTNGTTGLDQASATLTLTNSTTVTAVREATGGTTIVNYVLVEYF